MNEKKKIIISGENVHEVGYRLFLMDLADDLLIQHFSAKNIKKDGKQTVECLVGGDKEKIEKFVVLAKENFPENAKIDNISVQNYDGDIRTIESFSRSFSTSQLFKIANAGVSMLNKQDKMLNKQDQMLNKQDQMLNKQDQMLKKQDQTIEIIKEGNEKLLNGQNKMLEKQDKMLNKQDQMLKKQDQTIEIIKEGNEKLTNEMREFRKENKTILQNFHQDTIQRFDMVDVKYGKIAENMEKILQEMKEERKEFRETIERLIKSILEKKV